MSTVNYERKSKGELPVLAICYDFDKTLSPDDMQAQGYIQSVGYDIADFWDKSNKLALENDMDQNLAYMYMMKQEAEGNMVFKKETLRDYGSKVKLFPGVEEWFDRINQYGEEKGVLVEHYIISSGLKEMIEGTKIADKFEKIYASSFYYNERGVAVWPAQVVNYTNKTQFLFRIEKGVLDINDSGVNEAFQPEDIRVPFRNIIYMGDSDTDVPCMKLVNMNGGHAIGVYNPQTNAKEKVYKIMREGRIKYFVPADYNADTQLDSLVKRIIDKTAAYETLENIHYSCKNEFIRADQGKNEEGRKKTQAIIALEHSGSYATTHNVIAELDKDFEWTHEEIEWLFEIAIHNYQVGSIIRDEDVRIFYEKLLKQVKSETTFSKQIRDMLCKKE